MIFIHHLDARVTHPNEQTSPETSAVEKKHCKNPERKEERKGEDRRTDRRERYRPKRRSHFGNEPTRRRGKTGDIRNET